MLNWRNRRAYALLMRMDKPIGTYLLLWPTFWALWLAGGGMPSLHLLVVFSLGVFLMRSAGCVINDYADRHIDGHVKRTRSRPLVSGQVTEKEAILLFLTLSFVAFLLVLTLDWATIMMSVPAVLLAAIYPFCKRVTHLPQLVLGAAFSWAIPMAYIAVKGEVSADGWWLFLANWVWTFGYDTKYAMVDRDDDLQIGVKSTAILFGQYDRVAVFLCQIITLFALYMAGVQAHLGEYYNIALAIVAVMFCYQQWLIRTRDREQCFAAFKHNHLVGLMVFLGVIAASY